MADTGSGFIQEQRRGSCERDGVGSTGADSLGNADQSRLQGPGGGSYDECPNESATGSSSDALFPPGPTDKDAWRDIIQDRPDLAPAVEYEVRGMAARTAGGLDFARPDQLRSLGNMVVPQQGALALLALVNRAVAFQPNSDGRTEATK